MNNINTLIIPLINYNQGADMLSEVSVMLDGFDDHAVPHVQWLELSAKPSVHFTMAHGQDMIFLKYCVSEQHVAAIYHNTNDPVYKDSCVECFISFEDDLNYYNLEFNYAGTVLGEYGPGKTGRRLLSIDRLKLIDSETAIIFNEDSQLFDWQLTLGIPVAVFEFHQIQDLAGMTCRLNFYKCGDDLPEPHYLAWSKVCIPQPDFHRPEYFGIGLFEHSEVPVKT